MMLAESFTQGIPMKRALTVTDVQESFRHGPYWEGEGLPSFLRNVQALTDQAVARRIPIAQVFHQELNDGPADPFSRSSGLVRPMPVPTPERLPAPRAPAAWL
jgi:nicotinamidase-related amidase